MLSGFGNVMGAWDLKDCTSEQFAGCPQAMRGNSFQIFLKSQYRVGLERRGRGFTMVAKVKPSQISGQTVGDIAGDPICWKDNQKA
jgi:hypothetical protein